MIQDIKNICSRKHIKYLIILLLGMFIAAVIEMIGLGSIPIFIMIIIDIDVLINKFPDFFANDYIKNIGQNYLTIFGGIILILVFLLKNIYLSLFLFFQGKVIKVLKPLKSSDPKIIDYANSDMRSDFMDIYLAAKCSFCISTAAGFDGVSIIFRRPIAFVFIPLGYLVGNNENNLIITKHHKHKKNKRELTISEIFSFNVASAFDTKIYEINNIELKENSPEEIKDLVIEMDDRLNDKWKETDEDIMLQKKFWSIFKENIKNLNLEKPLHGKIKSKFGAKFLRENQNWIR